MRASLEPRALLFDMDGLLVDSEPVWFSVERAFVRARGHDWTAEHARGCIGRGLTATVSTMCDAFALDLDPAEGEEEIVAAFIANVSALKLKPGARELLDASSRRGLPVALASSSPNRIVAAVLEALALRPRFSSVVSRERVSHPKPAPDIFLCAARELAVSEGCIVLEDSYAGVAAARAANMTVIAVPEHPSVAERVRPLATAVVADLHEARTLLGL